MLLKPSSEIPKEKGATSTEIKHEIEQEGVLPSMGSKGPDDGSCAHIAPKLNLVPHHGIFWEANTPYKHVKESRE